MPSKHCNSVPIHGCEACSPMKNIQSVRRSSMSMDNDYWDLGRAEDDFNDFLDTLARGESTEAIDIDPSLAVTAKRVHGMAARTYPEAHLMYRTWSTVGAS